MLVCLGSMCGARKCEAKFDQCPTLFTTHKSRAWCSCSSRSWSCGLKGNCISSRACIQLKYLSVLLPGYSILTAHEFTSKRKLLSTQLTPHTLLPTLFFPERLNGFGPITPIQNNHLFLGNKLKETKRRSCLPGKKRIDALNYEKH